LGMSTSTDLQVPLGHTECRSEMLRMGQNYDRRCITHCDISKDWQAPCALYYHDDGVFTGLESPYPYHRTGSICHRDHLVLIGGNIGTTALFFSAVGFIQNGKLACRGSARQSTRLAKLAARWARLRTRRSRSIVD
jgi:hypothetical protein